MSTGEEVATAAAKKTLMETALACLEEGDSFAVIELIGRNRDPLVACELLGDLALEMYWNAKHLAPAIAFSRAGIQFGLLAAGRIDKQNPEHGARLRAIAKGMAYDLASFTWPGWNGPGIKITASDLAIGLDAARTNLRLAQELEKGDVPLSRAHWMLGAHLLAIAEYADANSAFTQAMRHASAAGAENEALLNQGYAQVSTLLAASDETAQHEIEARLAATKASLRLLQDGTFFVEQIETALRVFRGS